MKNIKFNYLYRDAGNYKKWAYVVFTNPDGTSLSTVSEALKLNFMTDGLFMANQIRIPEAFFATGRSVTEDDHCFHEFDGVEPTSATPNDVYHRSIKEFLIEVKNVAAKGWIAFDPYDTSQSTLSD